MSAHEGDREGRRRASPRHAIRHWRGPLSGARRGAGVVDMKLEVMVLPVADVERAKDFYGQLGWRLDADRTGGDNFRIVQLTPPGSECSIQFGTNMTSAAPGSAQGLYLIVSDIEDARDELAGRGANVTDVFNEGTPGARFRPAARTAASAAPRPSMAATARSPRSATLTATAGCCKRSRRGCLAGSTPPRRRSRQRPNWRARCGARRQPTASTRSASARQTRTGQTGTPPTWWPSRPGWSCRHDRL